MCRAVIGFAWKFHAFMTFFGVAGVGLAVARKSVVLGIHNFLGTLGVATDVELTEVGLERLSNRAVALFHLAKVIVAEQERNCPVGSSTRHLVFAVLVVANEWAGGAFPCLHGFLLRLDLRLRFRFRLRRSEGEGREDVLPADVLPGRNRV